MNRQELINDITITLRATSNEEKELIENSLTDIILLLELRNGEEILIEDLTTSNIADIKREVMRRYKYG